jgi:hypothetical protein
MIWAIMADVIVTMILFLRFQKLREIRGRLLPLCILTSVHTFLFLLYMIFEAYRSGRSNINAAADVLCGLYFFSPLVLLLFSIIYPIVLVERHRMNRPLGISCFIFAANILLQGGVVLAFLACTFRG